MRRRYKQGRGPGGYNGGGEEPYYDGPAGGKGEGPPGYSDGKYEGPPKKRRGGGYEEEEEGDYSDVYPGPGYSPLTAARSVCKQVRRTPSVGAGQGSSLSRQTTQGGAEVQQKRVST